MGNAMDRKSKASPPARKQREASIQKETALKKLETQAEDWVNTGDWKKQVEQLERFIPEMTQTEQDVQWSTLRLLWVGREKDPECPFHYTRFPVELLTSIISLLGILCWSLH